MALVVTAILVSVAAARPSAEPGNEDASGIRQLIDSAAPGSPTHHPLIAEATRAFYDRRSHGHAWLEHEELSAAARTLIERVARAQRDGLAPLRSLRDVVDSLLERGQVDRVDLFLTEVFLTYGLLLGRGQVAPEAVHADWHAKAPPPPDLLGALTAAVAGGDVNAALDGLAPSEPSYRGLREALGLYLDLQAAGGWGVVPGGPVLKPDDTGARVQALRERLRKSGDLAPAAGGAGATAWAAGTAAYDEEVAAAVRRFQSRHGLAADGMVGPTTLAALNVPLSTRVRQIALNMERHRWLPPLPPRRVSVNIPAQRLTAFDDDQEVMRMRVVTGQAYTPTPVLADGISHIVVPGDANPLGRLQFMFPNRFAVYLHDTPAGEVFDGRDRALSQGCVRVERPLALAAFALRDDPRWNRETIERVVTTGERRRIDLPRALPVYLLYWTAWVEPDGGVNFRNDLYGFDEQLTLALMGLAS